LILTAWKVFLQTVCLQVRQCIKERFILWEPLLPRMSVDCSPDRSAHTHTVTSHTSDRSAWHTMYSDKNVYPNRIHVAQQFTVSVCSGWFLASLFADLIAPDLPLWGYVKVKCVVIGQWPQKSPSVRRNQRHFNWSSLGVLTEVPSQPAVLMSTVWWWSTGLILPNVNDCKNSVKCCRSTVCVWNEELCIL
jgi:hypothetical protein